MADELEAPVVDPAADPVAEPATPEPAAPPPVAAPVRADLSDAAAERLGSTFADALIRANQAMRAATPAPEQPIADVSDQEIDERLSRGESSAALIRRMVNAEAERLRREYKREVEQVRNEGTAVLSHLSRQVLASKPFYKDYQREVDAAIASLPANMQANPIALENAYNYIIGTKAEEIVQRKTEEAARKARSEVTQAPAGSTTGRLAQQGRELDPDAILPPDIAEAAKALGGYEKMARTFGYKTVDDWLKADWVAPEGEKH